MDVAEASTFRECLESDTEFVSVQQNIDLRDVENGGLCVGSEVTVYGNGYTVYTDSVLFERIDGCVKSLCVDGSIEVELSTVGLFAVENTGCIEDCVGLGSIAGRDTTGGFVGSNSGEIIDSVCQADVCSVTPGDRIEKGGFCGVNHGSITGSTIESSVRGELKVGGIAGVNTGKIDNCTSNGRVTGSVQIGGITGLNSESISNCRSNAIVSGDSIIGGITGDNSGSVSKSTSQVNLREPTFPISGVNIVGGIAGSNTGVLHYVRSNNGCIAIQGPVGGIAGVNSGTIQYADCTRPVHGEWAVGGVCGQNNSSISHSTSTSTLHGEWAVGGLIGENNGTLTQSHSINQSTSKIGISK